MDWTPGGVSDDIEDRRDDSGGRGFGGGGFGFGGPTLGIGGIIVLGVLSLLFRENLFSIFSGGGGGAPAREPARVARPSKAAERPPVWVRARA